MTEQWGISELVFTNPTTVEFSQGTQRLTIGSFWDGDGREIVRFMPPTQGVWSWVADNNNEFGELVVGPPSPGNHGPVRVHNTFHFAYADGTPYRQMGTTCYVWNHQSAALQAQTLETLANGPFNKIRFCVFPKHYIYNENEPELYPFEKIGEAKWDLTRFNPAFFAKLEEQIVALGKLGIEADVILLHPYDDGRWGFDRMPAEADDRYLKYVVTRLAAFRNVWFSLANEYDFMKEKTEADWDRFIGIVKENDPYGHLTSIHNGTVLWNHTDPRLSHASIQNGSAVEDAGRAVLYRDVYRKPIVFDEVIYEGNIERRWGRLTGEEMVNRFWEGAVAGTYVGHGETFLHPDDVLWWSKGGVLHGKSPARLAFLRDVLQHAPELEPIDKWHNQRTGGLPGQFYLVYLSAATPKEWTFALPKPGLEEGVTFTAEVLDTWNMTITPVAGTFTTKKLDNYTFVDATDRKIPLPGLPWQAIRLRRVAV